jgi:hypothetical protein
MDIDQKKILGEMAALKQHGDYVGSTVNDTIKTVDDLEKRVAELEAILLMVKDIDWKTIRFKERTETF